MPGRSSDSPVSFAVGLAVAAIALVGTTLFGWEFGVPNGPVPVVIGVACAVAAVVLWRR
ncbi:multidrug transporter [Halolamina litorea]|uniref:Multidrug transporter n=1 Tax=Halolamina litorea TaxID=1515593 RepID=A0ABD6BRR9_9EURY|nr:multidrug transporter [Halolamina litorea]